MSSSAQLFRLAALKMLRAERCRSVADALDRRTAVLTERHRPVTALHHEEVWRGRAATAGRTRLRHVIGAALYSLGLDLATVSRALRSEAAELEREVAALRRRASALAEAEARAAMRARQGPAPAGDVQQPASAGSLQFPGVVTGPG